MPRRPPLLTLFLAEIGALALGVPVSAEPLAPPPPAQGSTVAPAAPAAPSKSPEPAQPTDFDDIEKALQADQAQQEAEKPGAGEAPAPASEQAPSRSAGRSRGQSLNPDLSLIADFAAAYFSRDGSLETGGHDPKDTGFNLQALELHAGSAVDPYFRFDANIVFGLESVEIEEAYATTLDLPFGLQARFGQLLTRFGRLNSTHPHTWDFVDQPFALGRVFGGEGNRGLGVELSWLTPLPWYVEWVLSSTRADGEDTARSFYGAESPRVRNPSDLLYVTALKQFFPLSDNWSLYWGVSGAFGPNATGDSTRTAVYGTDIYLKYRPITEGSFTIVSLQSEWLLRRRQIPGALLTDVNGYAQLFWRFAQRFGTAARYEYGSPAIDSDGHVFRADPLDPTWTASRQRVAANVTYWPTEFSRLRLQGSRDVPGYTDGVWAVFLAAELVTGAHGAHAF